MSCVCSRAAQMLEAMKRTYDPRACFLLEINSRTADTPARDVCPPYLFPETLSQPPTQQVVPYV